MQNLSLNKHAPFILGGLLAFYAILSLLVSSQESAIFDEKAHIPAAYSYVRAGDMRLNPEHPPLLKDLAGLPLLFLPVTFPFETSQWKTGINEQWTLGDLFINCTNPEVACNDTEAILFWSRLPIILIALLLGLSLFLWGRALGGTLAGLIATGLFVLDPNIIAHGHYVTTDIGIAAFLFFAAAFFVRFLKEPSWSNVVLAGLFLGLAQLTKFSAVLFFPLFGFFVLLYALTKRHTEPSEPPRPRLSLLGEYLGKFGVVVALCFVLIALFYALNTWNMPVAKTLENAELVFAGDAPAKVFARDTLQALADTPGFGPLAHYFLGVFMVFSRVAGGNTFYFLGTVSNTASSAYFPILFMVKETLPFLFFLVATLGYTLFRAVKFLHGRPASDFFPVFAASFQERTTQYLSVSFILFYAFISITGNLNIGFRHLFPILPFLYLLIAKTLADFYRRHAAESGGILRPLAAFFCTFMLLIPLSTYPNYLSYYNELVGGNKNGYMIATDSNYDWGQDLEHLRDFIDQHAQCKTELAASKQCAEFGHLPLIDANYPIRLDYFGGGNPRVYLQDRYRGWHSGNAPEPGWYAISAVFFQESIYKTNQEPGQTNYTWLRDLGETTRAGDSLFLFYVSPDDIPSTPQELR